MCRWACKLWNVLLVVRVADARAAVGDTRLRTPNTAGPDVSIVAGEGNCVEVAVKDDDDDVVVEVQEVDGLDAHEF